MSGKGSKFSFLKDKLQEPTDDLPVPSLDAESLSTTDTPPTSPAPPTNVKEPPAPKPPRVTGKTEEPKKKRGRPNGKRSDSEFSQVTAYIRKETHLGVQMLLLKEGKVRDFSDLVEELLAKWVKSRT